MDEFLMMVLEDLPQQRFNAYQRLVRSYLDEHRPDDQIVVLYSVFSRDECKYHDIQSVAYKGQIRIVMLKHDDWKEGESYRRKNSYESDVLENPTWLDLCVVANDMILLTGDTHHRYLESLSVHVRNNDELVAIGEFSMGS